MSEFSETVGKEFPFYGAAERQFKLGDQVWEAIEDEDDGYRSHLGTIEQKQSDAIFFQTPLATIVVQTRDSNTEDGFKLVDTADGHVWLQVGTDNTDDYYPYFIFEYTPKAAEAQNAAH